MITTLMNTTMKRALTIRGETIWITMMKDHAMLQRQWTRKAALLLGLSCTAVLGASPALAAAHSSNAMINLVRLLVAQGTISKDKGDALIAEATREAEEARAEEIVVAANAARAAVGAGAGAAGAPQMAGAGTAAAAGTPAAAAGTQMAANLPPAPTGTIRVPYIPDVVRDRIRDDIKADVMREAKAEGWASPGEAAPDWTRRVTLGGDIRLRTQSNFYSRFNSTLIPNFPTIIANGPINLLSGNIPFVNTTVNKYGLALMRARFNMDVAITPAISAGFQIATGNDANPISEKATLGSDFFKRNIYLTKAFVSAKVTDWASVTGGRFGNPFYSSDAMFGPELSMEGLYGEFTLRNRALGHADFKLRGGAFPLDFGSSNFPDVSTIKQSTPQKWLLAAQVETDWRIGAKSRFDLAAGYYDFTNVAGRLSTPCALGYAVTQCSTDGFSPYFIQGGNSLFQMRQIVDAAGNPVNGNQLLGLVQKFHVLDVIGTLHVPVGPGTEFSLMGDYINNLAFHRSRACRYGVAGEPVNNGGAGGSGNICDPVAANRTPYLAGRQGYQVMASFGNPNPNARGEWRVWAGYKYLESDATLDAFVDPDFHLGGTNAKGFILGGSLGVARNVRAGARWLSANQIVGDPLAIDVLQIDLTVGF